MNCEYINIISRKTSQVILSERQLGIVGTIEVSVRAVFVADLLEVSFFQTVVGQRLEVGQELVGEQFGSILQELQVSYPEHTHGVAEHAAAPPVFVPYPDGEAR